MRTKKSVWRNGGWKNVTVRISSKGDSRSKARRRGGLRRAKALVRMRESKDAREREKWYLSPNKHREMKEAKQRSLERFLDLRLNPQSTLLTARERRRVERSRIDALTEKKRKKAKAERKREVS